MTTLAWIGAAFAVLVAATCYDFAFARYTAATSARRATAAAGWSAITYAVGLIGLSAVLRGSLWLAIPEAAGLFLGTLLGVRCRPLPSSVPSVHDARLTRCGVRTRTWYVPRAWLGVRTRAKQ